jgi:hypothetical protein
MRCGEYVKPLRRFAIPYAASLDPARDRNGTQARRWLRAYTSGMSFRRYARIALHLLLALSLAMPAAASFSPRSHDSRASSAVEPNGADERTHAVLDASEAELPCHAETSAPLPLPSDEDSNLDSGLDSDLDRNDSGCCNGDCAANGCDRAACMHLAWLPGFDSILLPPPASAHFITGTAALMSRHTDTPLRPPSA